MREGGSGTEGGETAREVRSSRPKGKEEDWVRFPRNQRRALQERVASGEIK